MAGRRVVIFSTTTWVQESIGGGFPALPDIITGAQNAKIPACNGDVGCSVVGMLRR